jgi:3-deoxy-D-manno-octulosonate 8-phosphate phosphatase (KDO 8-P phosphatase)
MRVVRSSLKRLARSTLDRLGKIELMIFDVDGVLTDGKLWFGADGEVLKVFHVHDGAGIKALADAGIVSAVISGRSSPMVSRRCAELGIEHVAQGITDKVAAFDAMRHELGKTADVCGYMGDDAIDVPVMRQVGFAATVPNAAEGVVEVAHWVSRREGGSGAVRELCDLLIDARRAGRESATEILRRA